MNFKQLEYFVLAAELKNITAAAKKLHIAQPPLSRQISLLEEELGVTLIKRSNKGIELTEAGQILYAKAKDIFGTLTEMTEMIREADAGIRGEIRIGSIYSTLPLFIEQIKYLRSHYPLIRFKIMHGDPAELMEWLESGEIDLLFSRSPNCETKEFHYTILEDEELVLVLHRNLDPAPEAAEIAIEQLRDLPLCMLRSGKNWGYNEFLIDECQKHGFTPRIICECHDTAAAMYMVMEQIGASYQPRSIVEKLSNENLYMKPIRGFSTTTHPVLVWDDRIYLSRSVRLFLSLFGIQTTENFPMESQEPAFVDHEC